MHAVVCPYLTLRGTLRGTYSIKTQVAGGMVAPSHCRVPLGHHVTEWLTLDGVVVLADRFGLRLHVSLDSAGNH